MESLNSFRRRRNQNNICSYCDQSINEAYLEQHLEHCSIYAALVYQHNSRVRSRLYSAVRESRNQQNSSSNSEGELPSSMRYLQRSPDSFSFSQEEAPMELPSIPDELCRSSEEDNFTYSDNLLPFFPDRRPVYPLRPPSSKQGSSIVSCPVCFNDYSKNHSPLVLPSCGHTTCEACLRQIANYSSFIKCPVCRTLNFKEVEDLPINYALLELTENKKCKKTCPVHNLEIVGYCKTEDTLLCGACVFEHKDHDSFLLTDTRAVQLAEDKKNQIAAYEQKLVEMKKSWQNSIKELNIYSKEVNDTAEEHVKKLHETEKEMIRQIKEGTKACIEQVRNLARNHSAQAIQESLVSHMQILNNQLQNLKEKKEKFDQLGIVDKLDGFNKTSVETEPPDLNPVSELIEKLKTSVDYSKAIKEKKFPIE